MNYFVITLIVILVFIYIYGMGLGFGNWNGSEKFTSGYDPNFLDLEPVNYNTRKQNCDELTFTPTECVVDTVVPSNKIVCTESLTPITNNQKDCDKNKQNKPPNPTLSLMYDFDLLSSFNNAQINDDTNQKKLSINKLGADELETFDDLKTDVKSFNSLENDLMSNY